MQRLAASGLALVGALALAEAALRLIGFGPGHAPLDPDPLLHHVHPKNFTYWAYSRTGEYGGFPVAFDSAGWRVAEHPHAKPTAPCRIAFMGDSFTEALQVRYRDSFVGLLSTLTDCDVKDFGVGSYSPIFYAVQWRNFVRAYQPTLVVLQLFANDVWTDEEFMALATRDTAGHVMALPDTSSTGFSGFLRRSYLFRVARMLQQRALWWIDDWTMPPPNEPPAELEPDISPLTSELVLDLARDAAAAGARFVFFAVPSQRRLIGYGSPSAKPEFSDRWKAWAEKNEVPFVDMVAGFRGEIGAAQTAFHFLDGHYTETGHAITARTLCRELPGFRDPGRCADLAKKR
jgi:hypothetical protein